MTNTVNKSSVTFTATGIEPVAATFNMRSNELVNFATEYFSRLGIEIAGVEISAPQTGSVTPRLELHVFVKGDSKHILGAGVPRAKSLLSDRIETRGVSVSEDLEKALAPFALEKTRVRRTKDPHIYHIELDPLLLIALYLAADNRMHTIGVVDVRPAGGELIIVAMKGRRSQNNNKRRNRSMMNLINR